MSREEASVVAKRGALAWQGTKCVWGVFELPEPFFLAASSAVRTTWMPLLGLLLLVFSDCSVQKGVI